MKRLMFIITACILFCNSIMAQEVEVLSVIPYPSNIDMTRENLTLDNIKIFADKPLKDIAEDIKERLAIYGIETSIEELGKEVNEKGIVLALSDVMLIDESYRLEIWKEGIVIEAKTRGGIVYGVETLFQIIERGERVEETIQIKTMLVDDMAQYFIRALVVDDPKASLNITDFYQIFRKMKKFKLNCMFWETDKKVNDLENIELLANANDIELKVEKSTAENININVAAEGKLIPLETLYTSPGEYYENNKIRIRDRGKYKKIHWKIPASLIKSGKITDEYYATMGEASWRNEFVMDFRLFEKRLKTISNYTESKDRK